MHQKAKLLFSNFTVNRWQNLIILTLIVFYSVWMSFAIGKDPIQLGFAGDYLAFWSAGKIADDKGYSQIYDISTLRSVQSQALNELGVLRKLDDSSFSPFPVAILSVFVTPFQILSKISFVPSYWIWTSINLIVLIGYLIYFMKKVFPGNLENAHGKRLLLLMLISYPVWSNLYEGQVEVFLVICAGEFIRHAINKKPILSGLWLGGLLLKPQILILVIPILLFMRYWKAISGFILSSFILLMTSFLLSGFAGMQAMVGQWTKFSAGIATNSPEKMINWRMLGVNINLFFETSFGWIITGLGMLLTIVLVCILLKTKPIYGSSTWIITMAAVFSATLVITWHSHYHMAMVLIPFLIYASQLKLIPGKIIFSWVTVTSLLLFGAIVMMVILIGKFPFSDVAYLVVISGFCLNISILVSSWRYLQSKQIIPETSLLH